MANDALPVGPHQISRSQWGAAQPSGSMAQQGPPTEAFLHYSDTPNAESLVLLQRQIDAVRAVQTFHMKGGGWSDIGYHFVIAQPTQGPPADRSGSVDKMPTASQYRKRAFGGSVFVGRPTSRVPAAQLGHNTRTLAICVLAGPGDPVMRRTLYLIEQLLIAHPSVRTIGGHRDVVATSCPGDALYAQLPRIARATGKKLYKISS